MKDSWVDVGKYAASGCFNKLGISVIFIAKQKKTSAVPCAITLPRSYL